MEFAPLGQDGIPPTAEGATKYRMLCIEWKVAYTEGIEAFNLLNFLTSYLLPFYPSTLHLFHLTHQ
jgi:hypothetical protein